MKQILLALILLPLMAMPQTRNRQCKKCADPCSNCMAPPKDSLKIVINNQPCCQKEIKFDSVLTVSLIKRLGSKDENSIAEAILKWVAAISPIFLAWLAYKFATQKSNKDHKLSTEKSKFDNLLKADMEWIKDFRSLGSDVLSGLQGIQILQAVYHEENKEFVAAENAYNNFTAKRKTFRYGEQPQEEINMNNARDKKNKAYDEMIKGYRESIKPLMEFKICLSETENHKVLSSLIDQLREKMHNLDPLTEDEINLTISQIRKEVTNTREEIKKRA